MSSYIYQNYNEEECRGGRGGGGGRDGIWLLPGWYWSRASWLSSAPNLSRAATFFLKGQSHQMSGFLLWYGWREQGYCWLLKGTVSPDEWFPFMIWLERARILLASERDSLSRWVVSFYDMVGESKDIAVFWKGQSLQMSGFLFWYGRSEQGYCWL